MDRGIFAAWRGFEIGRYGFAVESCGAIVARLRRVICERWHRRRIRDVAKPRLRRKEKRRGSLLYSARSVAAVADGARRRRPDLPRAPFKGVMVKRWVYNPCFDCGRLYLGRGVCNFYISAGRDCVDIT